MLNLGLWFTLYKLYSVHETKLLDYNKFPKKINVQCEDRFLVKTCPWCKASALLHSQNVMLLVVINY